MRAARDIMAARTGRAWPRRPAQAPRGLRDGAGAEEREGVVVVDDGGGHAPGLLVDRGAPAPPVLAALQDQLAVHVGDALEHALLAGIRQDRLGREVDADELGRVRAIGEMALALPGR